MIKSICYSPITLNNQSVDAIVGSNGEFYISVSQAISLLIPEWDNETTRIRQGNKLFQGLRINDYTTTFVSYMSSGNEVEVNAMTLENFNKVLWHLSRKDNPHAIAISGDAKTTPIRMLFIDTMPSLITF